MDIPAEFRDSVAFVAYKTNRDLKLAGTAFFLTKPLNRVNPDSRNWVYFAVTARHLIEKANSKSIDGKVYFRLNEKGGGVRYLSTEISDWKMHCSKNVDASILPVDFSSSDFEGCTAWNIRRMKLTDEFIKKNHVGPGDDLFFPGLFVHHTGEEANIPIVRTGTIAAMPSEPIATSSQGSLRAYLIEARSIGGLSGSPVFLHLTGRKAIGAAGAWNSLQLLGMIQGHYGIRDFLDVAEDDDFVIHQPASSINLGIALVSPIDEIVEILDSPDVAKACIPILRKIDPQDK